jgi:L-ascorbate metabolism protein UlaG (beta-lactamase superfamily)
MTSHSLHIGIVGMILCSFGLKAAESPKGDLNGDLRVDFSDFAILADHWLEDKRPPVQVRWYGHTTWKIWREDSIIYLDPVGLSGAAPDATLVLVSHTHGDHYSSTDIDRVSGPDTVLVGPRDVINRQGWGQTLLPDEIFEMEGIKVTGVPSYNTNKPNHPRANNWLGFIIELGGLRFYYGGDTDVTPEMQALQNIDLAIIPVGGTFTMTATEAAAATQEFKPALSLPSHWGRNVGTLVDAQRFADDAFGEVVILQPGESLNLKERHPAVPLMAHWPLDETAGQLAYDIAGAHTGLLQGDAQWEIGIKGGAIALDGDGDCIKTEPVLNPATGPFTLSVWVQGGSAGQVIAAQTGPKGINWLWADAAGLIRSDLGGSGRRGKALEGTHTITDNSWHHVALAWNGSQRTLYVDGAMSVTDTATVTMEDVDTGLAVGASAGLDQSWQGRIDDVRIYGGALTAAQVEALAQMGL